MWPVQSTAPTSSGVKTLCEVLSRCSRTRQRRTARLGSARSRFAEARVPGGSGGRYRRALDDNPANASVHLQLGRVLSLQGRKDEAVLAYLRAFLLIPCNRIQCMRSLAGQRLS